MVHLFSPHVFGVLHDSVVRGSGFLEEKVDLPPGGCYITRFGTFWLASLAFSQLTAFGRLTSKVVEEDEDPLFRTSSDPLGGQCHLGLIIHSSFCMVCVCVCVGCDDLTYIYIYIIWEFVRFCVLSFGAQTGAPC